MVNIANLNYLMEHGGQLLTFSAVDENYGFCILNVSDIIEIPDITTIPTAPPFVRGLINHRGKAIPVMDLRLRLGLPDWEYDERSCIIVIEINNTMQCGLLVDRIIDVENVSSGDIIRSPADKGIVRGFVIREGKPKISLLDTGMLART